MDQPLISSINGPAEFSKRRLYTALSLFVLGSTLIFLVVFFYFFIGETIQKELEETMVVDSKSHPEYENWLTNLDPDDSEEFYRIRVFNLTNQDDVIAGGKPIFKELGPYHFRAYSKKLNVTFRDTPYGPDKDGGDIARFKDYEHYIFQPSQSAPGVDPLNDRIVTASFGYFLFPNKELGYNRFGHRMFISLTVQELLWGYLAQVGPTLQPVALLKNYTSEKDCVDRCPINEFRTGKSDPNTLGYQVMYNGETFCFVNGEQCWNSPERVEGTDGYYFHYDVRKSERLVTWLPDALRTVSFRHYGDSDQKLYGITLYRFRVDELTFQNVTYAPRNAKYDHYGVNGLAGISLSSYGLPVSLSQPHFYNCDRVLVDSVEGLNPNKADHDTYLDVEPITGFTMNGAARFQINFSILKDSTTPSVYQNVKEFVMPMIWIEEGGVISEKLANDFKDGVYFNLDLRLGLIISGCITGFVMISVSSVMLYRIHKNQSAELTAMM